MDEIHFNKEFLIGFIQAIFANVDYGCGPFKSDLSDFEVRVDKVENEQGEWQITIPYSIIGDRRSDLKEGFFLREKPVKTSIDEFRKKAEMSAEAINEIVWKFKKSDPF